MSVRPEKRKELSQTLQSIVEQMRKVSGCLHSGFYQNVENEKIFWLTQQWATQKDSEDHLRSDLFTVLMGANSLLSQKAEVMIHTVSCSTELQA